MLGRTPQCTPTWRLWAQSATAPCPEALSWGAWYILGVGKNRSWALGSVSPLASGSCEVDGVQHEGPPVSSLQTPAHPSCSGSAVTPAGSLILWWQLSLAWSWPHGQNTSWTWPPRSCRNRVGSAGDPAAQGLAQHRLSVLGARGSGWPLGGCLSHPSCQGHPCAWWVPGQCWPCGELDGGSMEGAWGEEDTGNPRRHALVCREGVLHPWVVRAP